MGNVQICSVNIKSGSYTQEIDAEYILMSNTTSKYYPCERVFISLGLVVT